MRNRMFIAAAGLVIAAFAYLTQPPAAAFSGPADTPQNASAGFAQPMLDTAAAETRAQAAQEMHPSAYTPAKRSTPMLALMIVTSLLSASMAVQVHTLPKPGTFFNSAGRFLSLP